MNSISHATEHKLRGLEALTVPLHEMFTSIEGEGPDVGTPTVFVRTAGCDFQCPFCDTRKSWNEENSDTVTVSKLVRIIERRLCSCVRRVSFTGGNPALHKEAVLAAVSALQFPGRTFNLEHPGLTGLDYALEAEFLIKLCEATIEGARFHVSMDVKIPMWGRVRGGAWNNKEEAIQRLVAHNELLRAMPMYSTKCTASVKVLVQSAKDFDFFTENVEMLTDGLQDRSLSYWVAPVRDPNNEVDKILLGHITDGLSYHPSFSRAGSRHITWRINPNLHVQLGLR